MRKPVLLAAIAVILTTYGSGCTTPQVREVPVRLALPERPVLPTVDPAELECLAKDVYERLEARQRERRQYCEKLEEIIKGTHVD